MSSPRRPAGYHSLFPQLRVPDATAAIAFYAAAFGATEDFRREIEGKLLIAVLIVGDSRFSVADASTEPNRTAGGDPRGNGLALKLYVDDLDAVFLRAIKHGAITDQPPKDEYFGERSAVVTDPFGFSWRLAEFLEEVPHDEIERRMRDASE